MIADLVGASTLFLLFLVALLTVNKLGERYGLAAEAQRKALHFTVGLASLSFPWIFNALWAVAGLCTVCASTLLAIRFWGRSEELGSAIFDVERRSLGELFFAVSIVALFALAGDQPVLYVVPILVLTAADGGAALIGVRYGISSYRTWDGHKSWEGTVIFFFIAFLSVLVPLLLMTDVGRAEVLIIACLLGLVGCFTEATSWHGLDNLFVPIGSIYLLDRYLALSINWLIGEFIVIVLLLLMATMWTGMVKLTVQAAFGAILAGYFFWAIGGAAWLIPSMSFFLLPAIVVRLHASASFTHGPPAVLGAASGGFFWLVCYKIGLLSIADGYFLFSLTFAAHLTMSLLSRSRAQEQAIPDWGTLVSWSVLSCIVIMAPNLLLTGATPRTIVLVAVSWPIILLTARLFAVFKFDPFSARRWVIEAALAFCASLGGLAATIAITSLW